MIEMEKAKGKAIKGVFWSAVEKFSVQGVQFIVSIILARLLTPEDFGLVAIVLVFSTIFQTINESGFGVALIHKLDRDELDYSTAFITNLLIGVVSYFLLFFTAPLIARFYNNENIVYVMRLLSLILIVNAIGLVPLVIYTIRVDFKTQARASLAAAIVSGVMGISSAYFLRNVYAIVIQQLGFSIVYVSLMILFARWKPSLKFSKVRFKELFQYAYKLICARVISVVFDDIYSLAIGKIYSPASLGCYNRAQSFQQILSKNVINIVQRVSTPILCEEQNDYVRMQHVLLKFMSSTALIVYPLLAGLMVLSKPLILVLLGEKWVFASDMLLYACPVGFFYLVSTFNRNIYNATGRTDLALKAEIFKKFFFVGIFLLTMKYDIHILLIGLVVISIIEMIIDVYLAKKQIGVRFIDEGKSLIGILLATALMGATSYGVTLFPISNILKLILGFIVGAILYIFLIYIFNIANIKVELKNYAKRYIK